jgi:hypothetical protein
MHRDFSQLHCQRHIANGAFACHCRLEGEMTVAAARVGELEKLYKDEQVRPFNIILIFCSSMY